LKGSRDKGVSKKRAPQNLRFCGGPESQTFWGASPKAYALRLLSYRSRSKKELSERLKEKGFASEEINETLNFLEGSGLIKDKELAEWLLQNALQKKYLGREGIKMLLLKRGIEKGLIDGALSNLTQDVEQDTAMRFVEKKLKTLRTYPSDTIRQKLWRILHRRGFSEDVISSVVKKLGSYPN